MNDGWTRRVLVVDDEAFTRTLIESMLVNRGFEVALCSDAGSARDLHREFDPDLVILDVNLGAGPSGLQLGFILEQARPDIPIMYLTRYPTALLSARDGTEHLRGKTILDKDDITSADHLVRAIEDSMRGRPLDATVTGDDQLLGLTTTQISILRMVAAGMTNSAIAEVRGTSERAVEKQVKLVYEALDISPDQRTNARVLAALRLADAVGDPVVPDKSMVHG